MHKQFCEKKHNKSQLWKIIKLFYDFILKRKPLQVKFVNAFVIAFKVIFRISQKDTFLILHLE